MGSTAYLDMSLIRSPKPTSAPATPVPATTGREATGERPRPRLVKVWLSGEAADVAALADLPGDRCAVGEVSALTPTGAAAACAATATWC
ncbi:hypothetical protein [Spirillospora sp. NPDC048823]|uniref:hypothetical protein n=1 Tax=unclassified Spirillospora TaxID=2642701 RepID=UPI0037135CC1